MSIKYIEKDVIKAIIINFDCEKKFNKERHSVRWGLQV